MEQMEQSEALVYLADGHTIWTPELADLVCDAFKVERIKPSRFKSDPPGTHKGLTMTEEDSLGVSASHLSAHIVSELGLEVRSYIGRGFQAQANARAIAEYIKKD